ncbi:glycosyltransferase family 4 protein [Pseudobacillus wudalianchiensis]|uniref:Glycosyl transferase n=1 Tax=Pseudobacillus wudalianchiensis TaxID=1743143 RepID=A0A1B9AYU5_9BACI|nr:glycosyltransferase family 4 protein [Bacillus wudalianchiensis]OCA88923.1 glycosyl transferase [Bacillus wudalianchiensis]
MKVCHLTSVHGHSDTRIFIKECRSLVEAGYEVHFIVPGVVASIIDGVHMHGVIKEKGNRLKRMTKTVDQVLKKGLEINADIYHFHDPELIPVGLKLKKIGKKVIYDAHEDVPRQILTKEWLPAYIRKLVSKSFEQFENKASRKFDTVLAATPHIRDRFLKLGCKAQDVNNYPLLGELKNESTLWTDKENAVCYVGGITFVRGIYKMVESLSLTDNIHMLLGGKFANSAEKEIVQKMNGWAKVKELGFLSREEVKEVYRKSKVGMVVLHPMLNYIDALPVKMFEYMAAGIPVIASDFPLWKGIIERNQCGLCVDPLDSKEIAQAIQWLIKNPEKAEEMGKNGRKAVETEYNWETESKKLIAIYEELLQK